MVKISNIPFRSKYRFINQERLEQIQSRLSRLTKLNLKIQNNSLVFEEDNQPLLTIANLGGIKEYFYLLFFRHCIEDIEDLIQHVKSADIENDLLIESMNVNIDAFSARYDCTKTGEDSISSRTLHMPQPYSRDENGIPSFWINRGTPERRLVQHCSADVILDRRNGK